MKGAVYKQFKPTAVKLAQIEDKSVLGTAKELGITPAVCAVESTNMTNKKKVRFRVMETHFLNMKLNILLHKAQSGQLLLL